MGSAHAVLARRSGSMKRLTLRRLRRGPLLYSLGGLAAIAAVTASAVFAFSAAPAVDPLAVGLASRVGVDGPLADSLRGVEPDRLNAAESAALVGVDAERAVWLGRQRIELHPDVVPFYRARALAPAWADRAARDTLLHTLRAADRDGLDPEAYHASGLGAVARALDARDPRDVPPLADTLGADLDLALTDALFRYAHDALGGRTDPVALYGTMAMAPRQRPDVPARLADALRIEAPASGVAALLASLQPQHDGYRHLREALGRHLGGAGPDSVSADLLRLNMERWRWMPDDLGDLHVLVDVPGYRLWLRERDGTGYAEPFEMNVVVGKPGRWQTPMMTDTMETVVFNPSWIIPASIQRESYGYVAPGGRVQDPGPRNPMGRAKFLFPNDHAIYIHDTNSKWGFSQDYRALSHGCVRAAEPRAFATAILTRTNGWTVEEVAERFEGPWRSESVALEAPLPVHLTYFTAWADASGRVRLSPDIYGRDAPLADVLDLSL